MLLHYKGKSPGRIGDMTDSRDGDNQWGRGGSVDPGSLSGEADDATLPDPPEEGTRDLPREISEVDEDKTWGDPLARADFDVSRLGLSRPPALFSVGEVVGGRYRIVRFLAEGGMGAVYEAEDEELGGRVALKAILPELGYRSTAVERFRREIQLSRKVTHPCVCRVFDVGRHRLESRGIEVLFLTMELLQGETLSDRLKRAGALSPEEALVVVEQIARALQAAHDAGVIHRDLKSSNVMLEKTGPRDSTGVGVRAVVTDFGLSRSVLASDDGSITVSGNMVGTPAYAAPEQIGGKPPTPACDIYSLGLVFYEMLAGKLPYADESPFMVAMHRLQGEPLPTPGDLGVVVDPRWEAAIERCLQIDPEARFSSPFDFLSALDPEATMPDRPRSRVLATRSKGRTRTWIVAGVLAASLAVGAAWYSSEAGPTTKVSALRVAVLEVELPTSVGEEADSVALVGSGVEIALERTLLNLSGLQPVDNSDVSDLGGGIAEVARATAADEVVVATVSDKGTDWIITLKRIRGGDLAVLWTDDFSAPKGDSGLLASAVSAHLRRGYPEFRSEGRAGDIDVRPEDYESYLYWYQVVDTRPTGVDWVEVADGLAKVRTGSPKFVDAYLLEARIIRFLYTRSRNEEYLDRAFQLTELAREMSPGDPRPLFAEIQVAYSASDLERVVEVLKILESEYPGEVEVLQARALLFEREGNTAEALKVLGMAVQRRGDWATLMDLARLEVKVGLVDSARQHLQEILELSDHNRGVRQKLAELELQHGDSWRAEQLYSSLLEEGSDGMMWTNLGVSQLLQKRYAEAKVSLSEAMAAEPEDPVSWLNLADVLLLLGEDSRATELYRQVVLWGDQRSPAEQWQDVLLRAQSLAHLGRGDEAVSCLQSEVVQSSDEPQVWFESSLVYAIVGDRVSAVALAERSLEAGMSPRWFSLPWFDDIREALTVEP